MKKLKKHSLLLFLALGLFAFGDPYKHVGNVENLGNYHKRVADKPFQVGEKLDFRLHYGFLNAGVASLEVLDHNRKINEREILHLKGIGKSIGYFDWFFKVRDYYDSYVDAETINPYLFLRDVNEGGFKIDRNYKFYHEQKMVDDGKRKKKVAVPENVQDILSAFYYARTMDFSQIKVNDIVELYAYLDYEVWPLKVRYKGLETVKVDAGTFECMRFVPIVQQGRIFKDEEDMNVYISNDKNKIPILAKADVLVGSLKMELTEWKGLAHPLAIKN